MFDEPTSTYLRGGSARTFQRAMGHSRTQEQRERDQLSIMEEANRRRDMAMRERMFGAEQTTRRGEAVLNFRAQKGTAITQADAARDVANIQGETQREVTTIQGGTARDVADRQGRAAEWGARMNLFGDIAGAVGGVVGSWLQQGVEKIRQQGDTDRLERLLEAAGPKGGGVYQDATGRGMPMQQPVQPGAKPIYDTETNEMIGREVTLSDGSTKFERMQNVKGGEAGNPFEPGTPQYAQWQAGNGAAEQAPPLPGAQSVKGEKWSHEWVDGAGNRYPVKMVDGKWQIRTRKGWRNVSI